MTEARKNSLEELMIHEMRSSHRPRVQISKQGQNDLEPKNGSQLLAPSPLESCSSLSDVFLLVGISRVPQTILRFLFRGPTGMGLWYPFFLVDHLEAVPTRNPKRFQVIKTILTKDDKRVATAIVHLARQRERRGGQSLADTSFLRLSCCRALVLDGTKAPGHNPS